MELILGTQTLVAVILVKLVLLCGHWCWKAPLWNPPSSVLASEPSCALSRQHIGTREEAWPQEAVATVTDLALQSDHRTQFCLLVARH